MGGPKVIEGRKAVDRWLEARKGTKLKFMRGLDPVGVEAEVVAVRRYPDVRTYLEMEGLRRWVRPQLDGYQPLFEAMREQRIPLTW